MQVSDPGLCATCVHAHTVRGARSVFWMCGLAATDPRFERYPRLPVLRCRGYTQRGDGDAPLSAPGDPAVPPP